MDLRALKLKSAVRLRRAANAALGFIAVRVLRAARLIPLDTTSNFGAWLLRTIGPLFREHRIGRENLTAAFPEKSPAEIETILRGVWENLGRVGAEFAHIDRLWDYDEMQGRGRIMRFPTTAKGSRMRLRDDGKPALVFAAHLGNWELAAVVAHKYGSTPRWCTAGRICGAVSDEVAALRAGCMGQLIATTMDAPVKLADALKRGSHVAMLVDQ